MRPDAVAEELHIPLLRIIFLQSKDFLLVKFFPIVNETLGIELAFKNFGQVALWLP